MSRTTPYPAQLGFEGGPQVARWRPLVQWLLATPQLLIAGALGMVRNVLTLISFFTVLFTKHIPRPLFDVIAMTYRYDWRVIRSSRRSQRFDRTPSRMEDDDARRLATMAAAKRGKPSARSRLRRSDFLFVQQPASRATRNWEHRWKRASARPSSGRHHA